MTLTQACHISRNCIASNQVFSFLSNYFNFPSNLFINSFRKVAPAFPRGDWFLTFCNFRFWNGIKNLLKMPFAWIGTEVEHYEKMQMWNSKNLEYHCIGLWTIECLWVEHLTSKLRLYVEWWRLWAESCIFDVNPYMQDSATKIYKVPQLSDKSFNQKLQFLNLIYITEHKLHLRRGKTCCYKESVLIICWYSIFIDWWTYGRAELRGSGTKGVIIMWLG